MRKLLSAILFFTGLVTYGQEQDLAFLYSSKFYNDSIYHTSSKSLITSSYINNQFAGFNLATILRNRQPVKKVMGYTSRNNPVDMYYFPGTSSKKALVIGGVHGSELSAIEVAEELARQLSTDNKPYYSVIIIPALFPDNAALAKKADKDRIIKNIGRYTSEQNADPNRQMPPLGKAFVLDEQLDAHGRPIEKENALLLQLIQSFAPDRIVNIHAIKDKARAGIFADPRTDCEGRALGFTSDSTLAVLMAGYIEKRGGSSPGNNLKEGPTALYYLDPRNAAEGEFQPRNLLGSNHSSKAHGVSLGGWASTAVCSDEYSRPAMRILTMEFPGYQRSSEYAGVSERKWYHQQVNLYASAIYHYFLQAFCIEQETVVLDDDSLVKVNP
jgi:hypothetical protein